METPNVLGPVADASVRPATAADVAALGAVQSRAWRAAYADVLPRDVLEALTPEVLAEGWHPAVVAPPSPRHRVLVAAAGPTVVGFAAAQPDGEIVALVVDPAHQRQGHGSRLLNAVADLAREDGVPALSAWSPVADGPRVAFFTSAGFAADGGRRSLELPREGALPELRLVAAL